tara:strand:- start:187 stop:756 length:570 start_codon:yes stop_codon:yes gene_type:complete
MSTRSNIAYEDKDGKVTAIYVHSDGYPNGVGHCLLKYWNAYDLAKSLFKFGNASSLGSYLKDCSFYARDWGRDKEEARQYNNEWCFLNEMSGDVFIEYIYLFKKGHWYVSEQKSIKAPKDYYDQDQRASIPYLTKMVRIEKHPHYKPEADAGKMTEKEMVSKIGQALQGIFKPEDMLVQGGTVNKKKFN